MNYKLEEKIEEIKSMTIEELAEKFNCKPEEICTGDYIARYTEDTVCPYKVILGFANFEASKVESLGPLEIVYGKKLMDKFGPITTIHHQSVYLGITIKNSKIKSLGKLRKVYGSIDLNPHITSLENIEFLGSNLYLVNSRLESLGNLKKVDGILNLEDDVARCKLTSLGNLQKARRLYINSNSLQDLGDLEEVCEIRLSNSCNPKVINLIETSLVRSGLKYIRKRDLEVIEN